MTRKYNGYYWQIRNDFLDILIKHGVSNLELLNELAEKANEYTCTPFSLWLREQQELSSSLGYVTTNLDYVWRNYITGQWMYIEEKRKGGDVTRNQRETFTMLHNVAKENTSYAGSHLIVFENTSPEDGVTYLDRKPVTREQLIDFLRKFKKP